MFRLGRPDVLPVSDYGVRKGFALTYLGLKPETKVTPALLPKPDVMEKRAEKWRPWRSVASWYMWRALRPRGPGRRRTERKKPCEPHTRDVILRRLRRPRKASPCARRLCGRDTENFSARAHEPFRVRCRFICLPSACRMRDDPHRLEPEHRRRRPYRRQRLRRPAAHQTWPMCT